MKRTAASIVLSVIILLLSLTVNAQCVKTSCYGSTNTGTYSSAIGNQTSSTGNYAFSSGNQSSASGESSTALGHMSTASGIYSFAVGYKAIAAAQTSIAIGYEAKSNYFKSLAIGEFSTTNATQSYAIGQNCVTNASQSLAIGRYMQTNASGAIALGSSTSMVGPMINSVPNSLMIGFNSTVPTFYIGPSSSSTGTGNIGIATTNPLQPLHISGNVLLTGVNSTLLFADAPPTNGCWGKWGIEYETNGLNFWKPFDPGKAVSGTYNPKGSVGNYVLFLKDDGNVGIGTNTPTAKLQVDGTTKIKQTLTIGDAQLPASMYLYGPGIIAGTFQVGSSVNPTSLNVYGPSVLTGTLKVTSLQSDESSMIIADRYGNLGVAPIPVGDQMGSHIATRNLQMSGKFITNDDAGSTNEGIFIGPSGNVGVKTNNIQPMDDFTVYAPNTKTEAYMRIRSEGTNPAVVWATGGSKSIGFGVIDGKGYLFEDGLNTKVITIQGGRVGIGIPDGMNIPTSHKLYVTGGISAEEVKVKLKENWSDYVFEPHYKLLTLPELESFIITNRHLPEIPPAAEVEKNGINLGEMNALLLKKIEELTLYIIEQEKRIKAIEEKD